MILYNFADKTAIIKKGERIGQATFVRVDRAAWQEVEQINHQSRGGFGSTG